MNFALTAPLADNLNMHNIGAGWWIGMAILMVLFMGGMMWMMMRGMGRGSPRDSSPPGVRNVSRDSPVETLERRLAEGEISIEDYRARREALVNGSAEPSGDHDEEQLVGSRGGEGRQR